MYTSNFASISKNVTKVQPNVASSFYKLSL